MTKRPLVVLLVDDDDDYYLLAKQAFEEVCPEHRLYRVEDGAELMDYLRSSGKYKNAPRPDVILLDLNMPRKNGHQALQELKSDETLKHIPVVVLTTSKAERDILESYQLGAHSYIWKPIGFKQLIDTMRNFCAYWFNAIELPTKK